MNVFPTFYLLQSSPQKLSDLHHSRGLVLEGSEARSLYATIVAPPLDVCRTNTQLWHISFHIIMQPRDIDLLPFDLKSTSSVTFHIGRLSITFSLSGVFFILR